jgi:hypothetical protein
MGHMTITRRFVARYAFLLGCCVVLFCFSVFLFFFKRKGVCFIRSGVVVGGGSRSLWVLCMLRPAGCLEFG